MEHFLTIILRMVTSLSATFFIGGAVLLFIRGTNNKARRMLAYTMLLLGILYLFRMIGFYLNLNPIRQPHFSVENLIVGNFYMVLMFLFPLEVVLPGWLSKKRTFLLFLPMLILTAVFFAVSLLLNQPPVVITSFPQMMRSLGHFNVWYRFLFLVSIGIYIYALLRLIARYEVRYIRWRNNHYSDSDHMDISWMRYYAIFVVVILIPFLLMVITGSMWSIILHTVVLLACFAFLFYKGLFYENPYPEDFFQATKEETDIAPAEDPDLLLNEPAETVSDHSFTTNIPLYIDTFRKWMETERPYLYKDFKLTDVSRILPLNRTYLSRIFNEGMGQSFSEVVRNYRIAYSKDLLVNRPALSIHNISELCGFASDSTFIRTFVKAEGITPKQFRMSKKSE